MRVSRALVLVALTFGMLALPACRGRVEQREIGDAALRGKVLIATESSAFKDSVVAGIIAGLEGSAGLVKVIDAGDLDVQEARQFDAIVVLGSCELGRLSGPIEQFLSAAPDMGKVILVPTSGGGRWRPANLDVDAVTAASRAADAGTVATTVVSMVQRRLAGI